MFDCCWTHPYNSRLVWTPIHTKNRCISRWTQIYQLDKIVWSDNLQMANESQNDSRSLFYSWFVEVQKAFRRKIYPSIFCDVPIGWGVSIVQDFLPLEKMSTSPGFRGAPWQRENVLSVLNRPSTAAVLNYIWLDIRNSDRSTDLPATRTWTKPVLLIISSVITEFPLNFSKEINPNFSISFVFCSNFHWAGISVCKSVKFIGVFGLTSNVKPITLVFLLISLFPFSATIDFLMLGNIAFNILNNNSTVHMSLTDGKTQIASVNICSSEMLINCSDLLLSSAKFSASLKLNVMNVKYWCHNKLLC